MFEGASEHLPEKTYLPLVSEAGEEKGVILVHSNDTRDLILRNITEHYEVDVPAHGGNLSSFFGDQLSSSSALVHSALQSRQLLQVIGTPKAIDGLKNGTLSILRSSGEMTGTVINSQTKKFAAQLRFAPAKAVKVVGPLAVWQILNAIAGVTHLQRINARLEALQRGIECLTIRMQAKTYGQIASAIATLEELSKQCYITGTFSNDMVIRLSLAERDIRSALAEQRVLVQRFNDSASQLVSSTTGKKGAFLCNEVLKEETTEFLTDAKLLTAASRASVLASESWLRHDLEHNPKHVAYRLKNLEKEIESIHETMSPLALLQELQDHAQDCLSEMSWFRRKIFNRSLANEIESRELPSDNNVKEDKTPDIVQTALIWKDHNNNTRSVIIDAEFEFKEADNNV